MSTELSSKFLEIPSFGRHFSLGTLYNALADQVIPGYTFWSENDLKNVKTTRNDKTKFSIISSDRLSEKLKDLNVNGSLQISILGGLIDLKGSANYLNKKESTCRESSIHVRFKYMTAVKSLTMDQLDESKIRYPEIAKNGKIGKATHVVTQIQYGAEATFTFTKRFESDDEEEKASGELKLNVQKLLKLLTVGAEVGGSVREKNNDSASNIDCQFEGDFKLPDNVKGPTTFEEALEFAKIFVKVSSDSMAKDIADGKPLGVPCTVWLFPFELMQDTEGAPAIRYEVSLSIASECVQLIEEYDNLEAKLNLMLNDSVIKQISPLYKKLRQFHQYLTSFRGELKTKLGKLIIDIRSGEVDVGYFRHLLDYITGNKFPLNPNGISDRWLDQKYKEFRIINRFKEQALQEISCQNRDIVTFFPTGRTLQNTMTSYSVNFCVEFTFPWLGRAEPFLEAARNPTPSSEIITEDDLIKTTDIGIDKVWYEDNRLVKRIQKEMNVFAKLVNEKSSDTEFAFVLTTPDDENAAYASESSIIVHHQLTRNSGWNGLQLICQYYPRDNLNDVVLLLLDDTADIDKYCHKFNCLFILCRFYQKENLLEFVQIFLDRKIDINCKDDDGWTPLLILCRYYDKDNLIDIVRLFLNEKSDLEINWRNNEGFNALHILCRYYTKANLIDIIKLFIQRKIDINCKTNIGWNALHFVCRFQPKNSLPGLVRLLIQNKVKSYAAFLIDRPFNEEDNFKVLLMNCLRYRLQIVRKKKETDAAGGNTNDTDSESDFDKAFREWDDLNSSPSSDNSLSNLEDNESSSTSKVISIYDSLLQLIDEFDATGAAEIFRLLLERRAAIPLFVPNSKKHYLSLLSHITLPRIDNIRLSEDKSLSRVAVISCRQRKRSQTCDILKSIFNIDSFHFLDLATSNISSESMLAEIGCGCIVSDGSKKIQNVLVVHVMGDFRPLWSFLRRFADIFLIEDSTIESESFFTSFMTEDKKRELDSQDSSLGVEMHKSFSCLWKPSDGTSSQKGIIRKVNGFVHFYIQDQLSDAFKLALKSAIVNCMAKTLTLNVDFAKKRWKLCDIPMLEAEGYSSLECVSPTEIELSIDKSVIGSLGNERKNEFVLQKSFMQEAKHHEAKMENCLEVKDEDDKNEEERNIKVIREQRHAGTRQMETNSLLQLFLRLLETQDPCSRVLSIRILEKEFSKRGEQELGELFKEVESLSVSYRDKLLSNTVDQRDLDSVAENLRSAKTTLIENVLGIEHLWRELSHLYVDMEPERRSPAIKNIPRLAAQHLMDGFCLELLDGDSNIIRLEWIKEVLQQLGSLTEGKGIFVLSVMGVQSSGKSTLLNTMFGIRMRTSVGQCTRGVNMQLLAVEGRPEYDYILLLDTEGTRSPEYHGLPGSEKRDNQMATLSILLSDATIVIMPGENDSAIKEILPIVLMAYQGSQLAEDNGGRLSSRIFFVYNRIDTSQKNKLGSIIQTLGNSLHEAFSEVQKATGDSSNLKSKSPFANFELVTSNSLTSDVCILGNVKKQSKPPGDVPDEAYGEGLIQFREHIHRRVTNVDGDKIWESRSIEEFSSYIEKVWKCICSANFTFTFATVLEHITFDNLDLEYKKIERKLAEAYENAFKNLKSEIMKLIEENKNYSCSTSMRDQDGPITHSNGRSPVNFEAFYGKLRDELSPIEGELDKVVAEILTSKSGREKWRCQFEENWKNNKKDQASNWKHNLSNILNRFFHYDYHVEIYKKKMRIEINKLFKSSTDSNVSDWENDQKNNKFEEMFQTIITEANKKFPSKIVPDEIKKVYEKSVAIQTRKIELKSLKDNEINDDAGCFPRFGNSQKKGKQNCLISCEHSVRVAVYGIAASKLCYDDSIIENVIRDVDSIIKAHKLNENSEVKFMHCYGMSLIQDLMVNIEIKWEKENSVPARIESNKEILRKYFMMVSQGVAKTKLFTSNMADTLKERIISAFGKEMVQKTFQEIRNECWINNARVMLKHVDLYLIDLLEKNQVDEVLENIRNPKTFYADVFQRLIAQKVPNAEDEWKTFKTHVQQAIEKAAIAAEVNTERAQTFVDQLRKQFLEGYLKSETLGSAFLIDFSGEYEDCDNDEQKEFQEACKNKLNEVLEKQVPFNNQEMYAKELSPEVVQHMITLNDKAALPRCDACCQLCKSMCIENANHDIELRPHDAVHQPGGVAGFHFIYNDKLDARTCNECYEKNHTFFLYNDRTIRYKFRDYATVFSGWRNPRVFADEDLTLRQYILATYNKEIADKYKRKPSANIPASYSRDLSSIKKQLERDIAGQ